MKRWGGGAPARALPLAACRLVLILAVFALAACTTGQGYPRPPRLTQAPTPSPTLTTIGEGGACLNARVLPVPPLRAKDLWPGGITVDQPTVEFRRGSDPARCPARLPTEPACSEPFPWTGLDSKNSFLAIKAVSQQEGSMALTIPTSSGKTTKPDSGETMLQYTLVQLPVDDPAGAHNFTNAAMQVCGGATPGEVAGTWVVRGLIPASTGSGDAHVTFVQEADHLLWLTMGGPDWTPAERDRVTAVAIARLLKA